MSKEPGMFCAGADLKERFTITNFQTELLVQNLRDTFNDFYNLPFPTIACIDGPTLGGGLELALACDLRIASKKVIMGLVETSLGIIPGAGGTQTLSRVIGVARAKELIYTSRRFDAEYALKINLINYLEEDTDGVQNRALELAKMICQNGPIGVRSAKKAINAGIEVDLKTGLEIEKLNYQRVVYTEDRIEALKAFKEKRKPIFKGK